MKLRTPSSTHKANADERPSAWKLPQPDIVTRPIYAGLVGFDRWRVSHIPGMHEPLISIQTFEALQ